MDSSNSLERMRRGQQRALQKAKLFSSGGPFHHDRQYFDRRFITIEGTPNLNALDHGVDTFKNFLSNEYAFITRMLGTLRLSFTHTFQNAVGVGTARYRVAQKSRS